MGSRFEVLRDKFSRSSSPVSAMSRVHGMGANRGIDRNSMA
jgi:hypothetical protein